MPVIHQALDAQGHAVVALAFQPAAPRLQALQAAGLPVPPAHFCTGMIDTGATVTVIDPSVRQALGLAPFRIRPARVPAHTAPVLTLWYKVDLRIQAPQGSLTVPLLSVVEMPLAHTGVNVLVGCDILSLCTFVYNGPGGSFLLSF